MRQEHWRAELCEALEVATCRPPSVVYFFARRTIELRIRSSQVTKERKHSNDARTKILRVRKKVNDVISAVSGTEAERILIQ